jgi:hypothetical protein
MVQNAGFALKNRQDKSRKRPKMVANCMLLGHYFR